MIIDVHTHLFTEKTYRTYKAKAKNISKALVLDYTPHSGGIKNLFELAENKKDVFVIGSVQTNKNISGQLKTLEKHFKNKQIFGIKLYPGYEYFYPSDKKIIPIAKLCAKYKKPLVFHSGDVWDPDNKAILKYSQPIHIDELAVKVPKCNIVISHFGFPRFIETANVVSKNPNVFTEISGTIDEVNSKKEADSLFKQYKADLIRVFNYFPDIKNKIMFGTDYGGEHTPLNQIKPYQDLVKQIFTAKEQNDVFYNTAQKIYFK